MISDLAGIETENAPIVSINKVMIFFIVLFVYWCKVRH